MQSPDSRSAGTDPRAREANLGLPASMALLPASVAAFGSPEQPLERLMGLQSAIARGAHALASIGQFRVALRELLRFVSNGRHVIGRHQAKSGFKD
jgi:hypothetical protein